MALWLHVLGGGSWSDGGRNGPVRKVLFKGGPHKVDADTAERARESGHDWLLLVESEDPPEAPEAALLVGPLTPQDFLHESH